MSYNVTHCCIVVSVTSNNVNVPDNDLFFWNDTDINKKNVLFRKFQNKKNMIVHYMLI